MRLTRIRLFDFKNYSEAQLDFEGNIQCFFGHNGSGKTNLLDAVYYLAFTKSAFVANDSQNIRRGQNQFFISGKFAVGNYEREITVAYQQGLKKTVTEDGEAYAKFSKHIGKYPIVMIAPNDAELIWSGSELRRRFFDNLLSQLYPEYLENLIVYTRNLKQRNSLLKLFFERGTVDFDLLDVYDAGMVPAGEYIYTQRTTLITEFYPIFERYYKLLADASPELVKVEYRPALEMQNLKESLRNDLKKDIALQRTTSGIHRDDFLFQLDDGQLKIFGSQGQQKSFLIALKLAEFELIAQKKQSKPLLLLDDIFDKLDDERINKLMTLVGTGAFGQLLITDARENRGRQILGDARVNAEIFRVNNNSILTASP